MFNLLHYIYTHPKPRHKKVTILFAQNEDSNLKGDWKIISVDNGDFYLNTKIDSVSISNQFKEIFSDSLELNNVINVAKLTYINNITTFGENGIYTQTFEPNIIWKGTYKIKPLDKKIVVTLNDNINWEMDYKLIDSLLYLKMGLYNKKTIFVLEQKVK